MIKNNFYRFSKEHYYYFHHDFKIFYKRIEYIKLALKKIFLGKRAAANQVKKVEIVYIILGFLIFEFLCFSVNMSPVQVPSLVLGHHFSPFTEHLMILNKLIFPRISKLHKTSL